MNTYLTSNRTLGQFPLSIATSLAIEAAFGIYPDRPETKEPILKYNTLWINIRTLFRNTLGAMEKGDAGRVQPPMLAITLSEEMTFIRDIIKERTNNSVNVVFYYSNYSNIETHFKHSVIGMDNTDKQKEYTLLHNQTIEILFENNKKEHIHDIRLFKLFLTEHSISNSDVAIITHYAIDLLSAHIFKKLTLLESHTGHFKDKVLWYTKFNGDTKELNQIPFNKCFITVFGDDVTFRPFALKTRVNILELAKKYNWTAITTIDKLRYCIGQLKNPYEKEILLSML